MRALIAIAVATAGMLAGTGLSLAADLPLAHPGYPSGYALGVPAAPLVIYDYEPGTVLRAYWLPPWQNRHYFPSATGVRWQKERVSTAPPRPAEPYSRYWSTPPLPPPPGTTVIVPLPEGAPNDIAPLK